MQNFDFLKFGIPLLKGIPIVFALFLMHVTLKYKYPLANALKSALPGIICLVMLSFCNEFTGIKIPINGANLGISALLGIPGVGMMAILNTLVSSF